MKLRINGNSVRMRLSPDEVEALVSQGKTQSTCAFPESTLSYGLVASQGVEIEVRYDKDTIQVMIPETQLKGWDKDNRVGFEHHTSEGLFILIEKDFQCLQPRKHEKEEHLYPNPSVSK